jgi:hypothetical protein
MDAVQSTTVGPKIAPDFESHPAVFLLDREARIRFQSIDRNHRRRTTMHTIFQAVAGSCPA